MSVRVPQAVVVIAASAGGIRALATVLGALPKYFPAPVIVVQHRKPQPKGLLGPILARATPLHVKDAQAGATLEPGTVYIARPDLHLIVTPSGHLAYSDGHRIRHVLSSANPLFSSAGAVFGPGAIGVVLTGTGMDGTDGVQAISAGGGVVIAQDRKTSQFFGMPGSAIATGAVRHVLPLAQIAPTLVALVEARTAGGASRISST